MSESESQGSEGVTEDLPISPASPSPSSSLHPLVTHVSPPSHPHSPSPPPPPPLACTPSTPSSPPHHTNTTNPPKPQPQSTTHSTSSSSSLSFLTSESMMDEPLAEAVVGQLSEVVERLSLSPQEKRTLEERVGLTGEAVQEALVFVATRSRHLDQLEEELETKELMLEMRELVVAAEVERQNRRLEELSERLVDKMNILQDLHDTLTSVLAQRYQDTVTALKDAAEGEEEARHLFELLDRQEGMETPLSESTWPEPHPVRGEHSRGAHFRIGKEEVFVHAQSGEVWVKVRLPDLDPDLSDPKDLVNDDVTPSIQSNDCNP